MLEQIDVQGRIAASAIRPLLGNSLRGHVAFRGVHEATELLQQVVSDQ